MAGAAPEQRARSPRHHLKAGGAERKRTTFQCAGAKREIAGCRKTGMNRSRQLNRVGAASLARWIVITALLAAAGLCYVYLTLQLHRLGDRKKSLETELVGLRTQNDVANVQIAALTSRSALQRRLKEGYLKMIPISEHNIVRLNAPSRHSEQDAVQPVVNQRARP